MRIRSITTKKILLTSFSWALSVLRYILLNLSHRICLVFVNRSRALLMVFLRDSFFRSLLTGAPSMARSLTSIVLACVFGMTMQAQTHGATEVHGGFGVAYAISETPSADRVPSPLVRFSLLHALSSRVAMEVGVGSTVFSSMNRERYADIATASIPIDLRLRLALRPTTARVRPFVFAGVGYQSYSYDNSLLRRTGWGQVLLNDSEAILSNRLPDSLGSSSWYIPLGAGVRFALSERSAAELTVTTCPTLNDDLNPLRDGSNDGWLSAAISFSYALGETPRESPGTDERTTVRPPLTLTPRPQTGEVPRRESLNDNRRETDSDNDSLSDSDEELKTHTNPGVADTDGDGLSDGDEVFRYRTNPLRIDTDGGSASDGVEVLSLHTDPNNPSDDIPNTGATASHDNVRIPSIDTVARKPASELASESDSSQDQKPSQPLVTAAVDTIPSASAPTQIDTLPRNTMQTSATPRGEQRFVFPDITFANNESDLLPSSRNALDSAFRILAANSGTKVEIQGYASKSRSAVQREDLARELSRKRARAVLDYLVYRGIAKNRLRAEGYGTSRPLVPEDPYDQRNRRIEFLVK